MSLPSTLQALPELDAGHVARGERRRRLLDATRRRLRRRLRPAVCAGRRGRILPYRPSSPRPPRLQASSLHLPTLSPLELSAPSAPHAIHPPPRTQLKGEELSYQLRWVAAPAPAGDGALVAVQDRGYNALQETRAFLGEDGTCEAAAFALQATAPHGELRLAFRDEEANPDPNPNPDPDPNQASCASLSATRRRRSSTRSSRRHPCSSSSSSSGASGRCSARRAARARASSPRS